MTVTGAQIERLRPHFEEQRAELQDQNDPFFAQQLEAKFADVEEGDAIFSYELVRAAAERPRIERADEYPPPTVVAIDPSGRGRDRAIAVVRRGANVDRVIDLGAGNDEMALAGRIVQLADRQERAQEIVVDVAGLGGPIESRLREIFREPMRRRIEVRAFNAAWKAFNSEAYRNVKTEIAFWLRRRFETGRIKIPHDGVLISQLCSYTLEVTSDGRSKLCDPPKSPDRADALIAAFYEPPAQICGSVYNRGV